MEKTVQQVKVERNLPFTEARNCFKSFTSVFGSRNPPKGLSGEPGPSKPTTGKDTKQLSKDAYSDD